MHEAGLAAAVAAEIRARHLDAGVVRLRVHGGHGDTAAFDAALRAGLAVELTELEGESIAIEHLPAPRLCGRCVQMVEAVGPDAVCPACHTTLSTIATPEWVELDFDHATDWVGL